MSRRMAAVTQGFRPSMCCNMLADRTIALHTSPHRGSATRRSTNRLQGAAPDSDYRRADSSSWGSYVAASSLLVSAAVAGSDCSSKCERPGENESRFHLDSLRAAESMLQLAAEQALAGMEQGSDHLSSTDSHGFVKIENSTVY